MFRSITVEKSTFSKAPPIVWGNDFALWNLCENNFLELWLLSWRPVWQCWFIDIFPSLQNKGLSCCLFLTTYCWFCCGAWVPTCPQFSCPDAKSGIGCEICVPYQRWAHVSLKCNGATLGIILNNSFCAFRQVYEHAIFGSYREAISFVTSSSNTFSHSSSNKYLTSTSPLPDQHGNHGNQCLKTSFYHIL